MTEASISEIVAAAAVAFFVGMTGLLIRRRRKHLKLVVRVVDETDRDMISFLESLVQAGELTPIAMRS